MTNKIVLITLLMSLATVTVGLSIQEQQVKAESIVGNYADGYEHGKEVGEEDSESGYSPDGECPDGSGLSYCAGYKVGYYIGYEATEITD